MKQRRNRQRTVINNIEGGDGLPIYDQICIRNEIKQSFQEKFQKSESPSTSTRDFLQTVTAVLTPAENLTLSSEITLEEIEQILNSSKKKKSPGKDGLTMEFYLKCWPVIKNTMLEIFKQMFSTPVILSAMKEGVLILIPKVTHPKRVDQFRPISLLNVDFKLFNRILAFRLRNVLPHILHPSQTGAIPGHSVLDDIAKLRDIIFHCNSSKSAACLLSLDLQSAFDNVHHEYLFEVMKKKGIDVIFIQKLQDIYTRAKSQLQINGYLTKFFDIDKGIRQGCPLSVYLFAIAINPLLFNLSAKLPGIHYKNSIFKLTAYVDDLNVMISHPSQAMELLNTFNNFGLVSGALLNIHKSKALPLGTWDVSQTIYFSYVQEIKILGIKFSSNPRTTKNINWSVLVQHVKLNCVENRYRLLCLEQRIDFIKMFILSKLWYTSQILEIPQGYARQIQSAILYFIWSGTMFRVPYPVLTLSKTDGGLNMVNIRLKCKALFERRNKQLDKSAKTIYQSLMNDLPKPNIRVVNQNPGVIWLNVWKNVSSKHITREARSAWYRAIHDLFPTNQRLHHIGMVASDKCNSCPSSVDYLLHRLTSCKSTKHIWRVLACHLVFI